MEKIYDEAMIRRVQAYMEQHKISQNQMAAKVNISSAAPVSYTHLDVYKRQGIGFALTVFIIHNSPITYTGFFGQLPLC